MSSVGQTRRKVAATAQRSWSELGGLVIMCCFVSSQPASEPVTVAVCVVVVVEESGSTQLWFSQQLS